MLPSGTGILTRLLAGCTTGAMAVTCAQPTDVVKVRFQAHVTLMDGSKKYNGTVDAYKTIAKEEGVRGLWKGTRAGSLYAARGGKPVWLDQRRWCGDRWREATLCQPRV